MERSPITTQRSPWQPIHVIAEMDGIPAHWWKRNVRDGTLVACVTEEPLGWHLSISFRDNRGDLSRYPDWDEIAHARYELLPTDVDFVMHLPKPDEYVALHDTTFHLHEHPER